MFLSKKNAVYFNKPKTVDPTKPKRILSGWEDDEEDKKDRYQFSNTKVESKVQPANLLQGVDFNDLTSELPSKKQNNHKFYLNWDQLDSKNDIQCEKRLIEEIVQPGGIRIKPNDTMLNQFAKQIKGMEVHIIGSLLLSKIQVNYPFQTKAKALYTIEFLTKKNEVYLSYFKANLQKLKQFPEPEDNVDNYRKILKNLLNMIGGANTSVNSQQNENIKQKFVDPGYNDDPKFTMSNFIQQNATKAKKTEVKKVIIGPGQIKQKQQQPQKKQQINNDDFLNLDLLGSSVNNPGPQKTKAQPSLLEFGQAGQLSFDQMMGGFNSKHNGPSQKNGGNSNFLI